MNLEGHASATFKSFKTKEMRYIQFDFLSDTTTFKVFDEFKKDLKHDIIVNIVFEQLKQDLIKDRVLGKSR